MKKATLKVLVSLTMVFAILLTQINFLAFTSNAQPIFSDIAGNFAEDTIKSWAEIGWAGGYSDGTFRPNNPVTRVEFISFLNRSLSFQQPHGESKSFKDVPSSAWFYSDVDKATRLGVISGYSNGNFGPTDPITRQDAAVVIEKYFYFLEKANLSYLDKFVDKAQIAEYAKNAAAILTQHGIIKGKPGNKFAPKDLLTRAEAIVVLDLARNVYIDLLGLGGGGTVISGSSGGGGSGVIMKYTVSFNLNYEGAINHPQQQSVAKNSLAVKPVDPTREGYTFDGWYKEAALINAFDFATMRITSDITLYAKWKAAGQTPYIIVNTIFPSGQTTQNTVDVSYTTGVEEGATVAEVYYSINGGAPEYIYLKGNETISSKGTLGTGLVCLVPGENNIVFTVKDSNNNTGAFTVANKPIYEFGTTPGYDAAFIAPSIDDDPGTSYVTNRIVAFVKDGVTDAQVEGAISGIGGTIVGKVNMLGMYYIQVTAGTEVELDAICSGLMTNYPAIFDLVTLDIIDNTGVDAISYTNDPWWNDWTVFQWYNNQWGLEAIDIPAAWSAYSGFFRDTKVGVADNGFHTTHEDLQIPGSNVYNRSLGDDDHGSHVIGTIGAIHNNSKGLAGVMNVSRNSLYGYDCFDVNSGNGASRAAILTGLAWNVANGAKAINFSLGINGGTGGSDPTYAKAMQKLISQGYDFLVVQAAGNSTIDASRNGVFSYVTDPVLRQRIITVGASTKTGAIASYSNYGTMVDVVAPGSGIYSTTSGDDSEYGNMSGTSMAAPHVTGLATLVWSANPGLSAAQVKQIIVTSASAYGLEVSDNRSAVLQSSRLTYHQINAMAAVQMAISVTPALTTGRLVGQVIAATPSGGDGNVVPNAHISLYSTMNDPEITSTISDTDGQYCINGINTGRYYLVISAEGYLTERFYIQIEAGVTTFIHRLKAVPSSETNGTVNGAIINAFTGEPVNTAIKLDFRRGIDYDATSPGEIVQSVTSSSGSYSVSLPAGNYTVTASGENYITTTTYIYSFGGSTISGQNIVISPSFSGGASGLRIVLTWGENPPDLDSHLVGPMKTGGNFHVWYNVMGYYEGEELCANLDVDDTSSYGPETVTISKLTNGTYDYYIQDFNNHRITTSDYLRNSQAVIRVYSANNELLRTFNVPTGGGPSTIWHVFSLSVQDGVYTVIPINTMSNTPTNPDFVGGGGTNPELPEEAQFSYVTRSNKSAA